MQAALLSVPGASAYTTCWGGAYSTRRSDVRPIPILTLWISEGLIQAQS